MRFIYFLIFLLVPFGIFAQENTPTETPDTAIGAIETTQTGVTDHPLLPQCSDVIGISGAVQVRLGTTHEYSLVDNNGSVAPDDESIHQYLTTALLLYEEQNSTQLTK